MWGVLINGIQAAGLEHEAMTKASWNGATSEQYINNEYRNCFNLSPITVGLLVAYTSG